VYYSHHPTHKMLASPKSPGAAWLAYLGMRREFHAADHDNAKRASRPLSEDEAVNLLYELHHTDFAKWPTVCRFSAARLYWLSPLPPKDIALACGFGESTYRLTYNKDNRHAPGLVGTTALMPWYCRSCKRWLLYRDSDVCTSRTALMKVVQGFREAPVCLECSRTKESARLRTMPYVEYLATSHWRRTRDAALERGGHRCALCATTEHHNTYVSRGAEAPEDLVVLCDACHTHVHTRLVADSRSKRLLHAADGGADGCPLCASPMLPKSGKHGLFLSCSKYPSCKGTRATSAELKAA